MVGKVNYKFVALLCTILIVCTLGLVGLWYTAVRTDPAEMIARGDGAFQQGQFAHAASLYSKALNKRPNDAELILKLTRSIAPIEVSEARAARESVQQLRGAYSRALQIEPTNVEAFEKLMELTLSVGRDLGDFDAWNQMVRVANSSLKVDPTFNPALKYRGIAQVNRIEAIDASPDDRNRARADLEAVAQADPEDVEVAYHLARWHLIQARNLARGGNQPAQVSEHHLRAEELAAGLIRRNPNDPLRQLYHIRVLTALEQHDKVLDRFARLETQMLQDPAPADVALAVADRIAYLGTRPVTGPLSKLGQDGLNRTEKLLRAASVKHPDDLRIYSALGRTLTLMARYDQAMQILDEVVDKPIVARPIEFLRDADLQRRALSQHADLTLTQAKKLGPQERELALKQVEALVRKLQGAGGQNALVYLMQGKVAMVREQWATALAKLDRASTLYKDQNPKALLYSATARIKLGETGAAIDRLERLIDLRPDYMPARYELLRLHLRLSQYDRLQKQIDATLALAPGDYEAHRYHALMLSRRGNIPRAINAFEKLQPEMNPSVAAPLARLYVVTNQKPRAIALLQKAFEVDPGDPNVLLQLVNLTDDKDRAGGYIQQARQAGANAKVLKLFEQKVVGQLDQDRIASIEQLISQEEDPHKRLTNRYRLYRGLGRQKQADTELAKLAVLKPGDPLVVEAQFDQALRQRDWEQAQKLARRASMDDLDLAAGSFFQGRLDLARGRPEMAVASFERGLTQRAVYSRGWRDLADAQRAVGDVALAATSYRKALEQNPSNVDAVRGLVAALDAQGRHDEAPGELRELMLRGPESSRLLDLYLAYEQQHGNPQRALEIRRRLAEKNPDDSNNLRALAVMFAQHKAHEQVAQIIGNLIAREGRSRQNLYAQATVMSLAGKTIQARQLLENRIQSLGQDAQEDDYLILARFLMRTNKPERAIGAYRKAIDAEDPRGQAASRELADQLFAMGRSDEAAKLYAVMHERDQDDQRIAYRYVEALIRANQTSKARNVLHQIVQDYQPTASAYLLASVIARQEKDLDKAMTALDHAAELEPNRAMIYYERAQLRKLIDPVDTRIKKDLQQAVALDPDLSAARRQLTQRLLETDDRNSAIRELTELMQRHPNDPTIRVQLAELYYADRQIMQLHALMDESARRFPNEAIWPRMQGRLAKLENRPDLALSSFQRAFTLTPKADVLTELIEQLLTLRKIDGALTLLREHKDLIESDSKLQAMRGRALTVSGFADQGRAVFGHAISLCRSQKQTIGVADHVFAALDRDRGVAALEPLAAGEQRAWVQMAIAQNDIEYGEHQRAVSRLRAIEQDVSTLSDDRIEYFRLLALSLHKSGQYTEALTMYRRVLELDADNFGALNNLAYLLAENLGRAAEAIEPATRAAQLSPQSAQVLDTLGWVQHLAGRQTPAINTLKRSVHLQPIANNCYHLAVALRDAGEYARGHEMLVTARGLAQKNQDLELLELINTRLNE